MVTLRFFAAARAAVGEDSVSVAADTLDSALAGFDPPVIARCSFLVNGVATTDLSHPLEDGDLVDVLPPFAGG